jgi:hypothetical protein
MRIFYILLEFQQQTPGQQIETGHCHCSPLSRSAMHTPFLQLG